MEELALADYLAVLRRWKKVFSLMFAVFLTLVIIFVAHWSNYTATATVQIEPQEIPSSTTAPLGGSAHDDIQYLADQRVSEIQQKVVSTASLIEIITKFDLYAEARKNKPIAALADTMRRKVKIKLISSDLANPAAAGHESANQLSAIAFELSFDYGDPLLAQQVTDELVTRFLNQDLLDRRNQAHETSLFLAVQIAALETSMAQQEAKIADYEKQHGASRPESFMFNQQALASMTLSMQTLDGQITTNEGQIGALRGQLVGTDPYSRVIADGQLLTTPSVQLKALQAQYASLTAQYGPEHPDVTKVRHQIEALKGQVGGGGQSKHLKAQLRDARANLMAAENSYGPDHPDVIALRQQVNKLQAQLESGDPDTSNDDMVVRDADNPSYLLLVSQLHTLEEQGKSLHKQREELKTQLDKYQTAVMENPQTTQEMAALTRDYENAQLRYRELKEKKMAADMDEQMQKDRKGGGLTLVDPPELPVKTHPAQLLLFAVGLVFSLLGSLVVVVLAQMLNQSIVGRRGLTAITGVAPLVVIPHIYTAEERTHTVWRRVNGVLKLSKMGKSHG